MLLWVKKFIKDFISMKGPVPFDKYEYIYNNLKTLLSSLGTIPQNDEECDAPFKIKLQEYSVYNYDTFELNITVLKDIKERDLFLPIEALKENIYLIINYCQERCIINMSQNMKIELTTFYDDERYLDICFYFDKKIFLYYLFRITKNIHPYEEDLEKIFKQLRKIQRRKRFFFDEEV